MAIDNLYELLQKLGFEGTSAERVHALLRHCFINGIIKAGTRFRIDDIANQLKVSRTPVRDAVHRLEAECFIEIIPRQGFVVKSYTEQQIFDIYYIREALEGLAVRLAAERITQFELISLKRLLTEMEVEAGQDVEAFRKLTREFYLKIAQASRNERLSQMVGELLDRVRQFRASTLFISGCTSEALSEHKALVSALEQRDPMLAEQLVRKHRQRILELQLVTDRKDAPYLSSTK